MSKLKRFLDKRSEGLAKEHIETHNTNPKEPIEENLNLSDEEFWAISNQYIKESRNSNKDQVEILQKILEQYTPLKIKQFANRYEELNK